MTLVLSLIDFLLMIAQWIIVIQAILSWLVAFNVINTHNDFMRSFLFALQRMTEPLYRPIRRILPDLGMLDLSPLVVLLFIIFIRSRVIPYFQLMAYNQGLG